MNRTLVNSEMVRSVGYDPEMTTLEVEFNHGGTYQYYEVSATKHAELMKAESIGRFVLEHIKDKHPFKKIE